MKLWVVGRNDSIDPLRWVLIGVYSDEQRAISECKTRHDFVGPITSDEPERGGVDEDFSWPGAYYPLAKGSAQA